MRNESEVGGVSPTGKSLMSALRVCARDDVIPVAGSRGANMSCCCCSFARFPLCFFPVILKSVLLLLLLRSFSLGVFRILKSVLLLLLLRSFSLEALN